MSMEKHYYDPGTMIGAAGSSRMACWQSIRKECRERGFPLPALSDLVEVLAPKDDVEPFGDYTPWKEFSPDMLKDGMEMLVRTRDGDHHHGHFVEKTMIGPIFAGKEAGVTFHPPYSEITHVFVINPLKP